MQIADAVALGHQQPRGAARPRGPRRDQPLGQVEIEIAQASLAQFTVRSAVGRRKISRNMPGVRIDSGLTETCGVGGVPRSGGS